MSQSRVYSFGLFWINNKKKDLFFSPNSEQSLCGSFLLFSQSLHTFISLAGSQPPELYRSVKAALPSPPTTRMEEYFIYLNSLLPRGESCPIWWHNSAIVREYMVCSLINPAEHCLTQCSLKHLFIDPWDLHPHITEATACKFFTHLSALFLTA